MASLTRRAELAGEAAPKRIDVIAKVTAECWEQETVEFQRDCKLAMEHKHQQVLKGWEASLLDSPTRTAEEIAVLVTYSVCIQVTDAIHRIDTGHPPTRHSICNHSSTRSSSGLGCVRRCCSLGQSENGTARSVCRGESKAAMYYGTTHTILTV
jgi:hypothetical protein